MEEPVFFDARMPSRYSSVSFAIPPMRRSIFVNNGSFDFRTKRFYLSFPWIHFRVFYEVVSGTNYCSVFGVFSQDLEGSVLWNIPLPNVFDYHYICLGKLEVDFDNLKASSGFIVNSFFAFTFTKFYNLNYSNRTIIEWNRKTKENKNWVPGDDFLDRCYFAKVAI